MGSVKNFVVGFDLFGFIFLSSLPLQGKVASGEARMTEVVEPKPLGVKTKLGTWPKAWAFHPPRLPIPINRDGIHPALSRAGNTKLFLLHKYWHTITKRRYFVNLLMFFLFVGSVPAQTEMTATEADALRTMVKERAEKTQTITSAFTQYKHLDFLSNDIESNGKLAFKAPDLVKWEYVEPFAYSILFKNQTLYINDDGNKSNFDVGGNKIFKQLNQLITSSIRGDLFDDAQFDITYFKENENSLVHFTPKDAQLSEFIEIFHITFNTAGQVTEVKMIEPSEDYTHIVFDNRIENQPISDADFAQ